MSPRVYDIRSKRKFNFHLKAEWGNSKINLAVKIIALNIYSRKKEISQINNLSFHTKK